MFPHGKFWFVFLKAVNFRFQVPVAARIDETVPERQRPSCSLSYLTSPCNDFQQGNVEEERSHQKSPSSSPSLQAQA